MKNVDGDCIPVQAKQIVNNVLSFLPPSFFISFSLVLTLSVLFYISIHKLSASLIDLIVRARMKYLNLGFDLQVVLDVFTARIPILRSRIQYKQ